MNLGLRTALLVSASSLLLAACTGALTAEPAGTVVRGDSPREDETVAAGPSQTSIAEESDEKHLAEVAARFANAPWKTNFALHSVPYEEIRFAGPPRNGIRPIYHPIFESVRSAEEWLAPQEPVIHLSINGETKAYPLRIITRHEIVNDVVGGEPVAVTFCPLCNTAIAFSRETDGQVLAFGTSGFLRNSDLVMWDDVTESWWQQITGEAIMGDLTGERLGMLPSAIVSWEEFAAANPDGAVLSLENEYGFPPETYFNPYVGYDLPSRPPFAFAGAIDERLLPMERVVGLTVGDVAVAYPFSTLAAERVVHDTVNGQEVVVLWLAGTTSALDRQVIADSRNVGAAAAYVPVAGEYELNLRWDGDSFVDEETGSEWNILGEAVSGPLAGARMDPVIHANHFWFAWAAFYPATELYTP